MGALSLQNNEFDYADEPNHECLFATPNQLWAATSLFLTELSIRLVAFVSDGNSNHCINPEYMLGESVIYADSSVDRDFLMENNNIAGIKAKRIDHKHYQLTRAEYEAIIVCVLSFHALLLLSEIKMKKSGPIEDDYFLSSNELNEFLTLSLNNLKCPCIVLLGDSMNVQFFNLIRKDSQNYLLADICNNNKTKLLTPEKFENEFFGLLSNIIPVKVKNGDSMKRIYITPRQFEDLKNKGIV